MSRTFMNEPFTLRLACRSLWALFIRPSFSPYAPGSVLRSSGSLRYTPNRGAASLRGEWEV